MTNELQTFDFEGQDLAIKEINGEVYFNAEQAAIGLGISEIAKSGNVVVKWVRVNKYLGIDTSVDGKIKRGDYITEPQFYKLAIKANNPVAERFQDWVTSEVLPAIRKHGAYMTDHKAYDITHDKSGTALADLLQQAADQAVYYCGCKGYYSNIKLMQSNFIKEGWHKVKAILKVDSNIELGGDKDGK